MKACLPNIKEYWTLRNFYNFPPLLFLIYAPWTIAAIVANRKLCVVFAV
ncbi:MAG: hypothetical protein F6K35_00610 [Okeania sp. SIO2H7]|nr:hypothetical protein [Okeania sp. SIO2H7]